MTYPLPMRNQAIEDEAGDGPVYPNGEYPVALNETQQRQMEARGWTPALVPVEDLTTLSHDALVSAVEQAGIEVPKQRATKAQLADLLTKRDAEVVLDVTTETVIVNPETKEL